VCVRVYVCVYVAAIMAGNQFSPKHNETARRDGENALAMQQKLANHTQNTKNERFALLGSP